MSRGVAWFSDSPGHLFMPSLPSLLREGGTVMKVLASHQYGPGLIPRPAVICRLSLLLVFVLAPTWPRVFSKFCSFRLSNSVFNFPIQFSGCITTMWSHYIINLIWLIDWLIDDWLVDWLIYWFVYFFVPICWFKLFALHRMPEKEREEVTPTDPERWLKDVTLIRNGTKKYY